MKFRGLLLAAGLTAAAVSQSQVVHTARYSKINYNYVFGAGGTVFQDNVQTINDMLEASDTEQLQFDQSNSGTLSGNPWTAGVSTNQIHSFLVTGPATDVSRFEAQGQTDLFTHASGPGLAQMINSNPGNQLQHSFTVVAPQRYFLSGTITVPPSALPGNVLLERWDGFTWQGVFNSWFIPGSTGPFSSNGILLPGDYRITATLSESCFGNASDHCDYTYVLDFKPFTYHSPTNFEVISGTYFGGDLNSLLTSNDDPVIVLNDETAPNGVLEITSFVDAGTISELRIKMEGKADRSDMIQYVRMFNYTTQAFVNVSIQAATTVDSVVNGSVVAGVTNYVGPGGQVKAQVHWIPQEDILAFDGWSESCDFVQWTRVP